MFLPHLYVIDTVDGPSVVGASFDGDSVAGVSDGESVMKIHRSNGLSILTD